MTVPQAYERALHHYQEGRLQEADALLRQVLTRQPEHADALHLVGVLSHRFGRTPKAAAFIRRALALNPNSAEYHNNLALVLAAQGEWQAAVESARRAVALKPDFAQAWNNLGTLLSDRALWDEAEGAFRRALALRPESPEALANLGSVFKQTGRLPEAMGCYERALRIRPDPRVGDNLVYLTHFHPDADARRIGEAHAWWNRTFAQPVAGTNRSHANSPEVDRRLRIGYVSPDFREHSVARFLAPVVERHDRSRFEICFYSDVAWPDAMTDRLQKAADLWRDTAGLSHEELAERIREDRVDVLVDLTMHMEGNRLLTFARRPAPVQVTWLAYCSTTGLQTIDWRLTDPQLDPPGEDESVYSEQSLRLRSYWCYEPPPNAPEPGDPPGGAGGSITFGSLNNFSKVTPPAVAAWIEILKAVPGSNLLLHSGEGAHRERLRERFRDAGVDPDRIRFAGRLPFEEYLALHRQIDIALDSFPWAGGTTTCDALWMGVPVVSLAGRTAVSRGGRSILSTIGLPQLVAANVQEYVRLAVDLAGDRDRLRGLRAGLRDRMRASPLMDAPAFARDLEAAYRTMWRDWCRSADRSEGGSSDAGETAVGPI